MGLVTLSRTPAHGIARTSLSRRCRRVLQSAILAACACAMSAPAAASQPPEMARVRDNGEPSVAALIREATARSATFRHLVETIDASDGIVYVQTGRGRCGVRAYLALTVTMAGPNRVLRVVVDPRRERNELMAAIGHELRHAIEVLGDRAVTNDHAIYFFYHREGRTGKERFETRAAKQAGDDVFRELSARGVSR